MADEQHRHAKFGVELAQQGHHLRLHRDVECARGLVSDEKGGTGRQCAGNSRTLALPAAHLVGIASEQLTCKAASLEQLPRLLKRLGLRGAGIAQSFAHRLAKRTPRVK